MDTSRAARKLLRQTLPTLTEVYEAYHRRVVAYAARLLGADEAQDVAQEVFVKVGRSLGTLSDPARLASWVYAVTLNTARDHARRRAAAPFSPARDARVAQRGDAADPLAQMRDDVSRSPEQAAIRNEMVACYLDQVRRLPRRYAVVYALSEFEELTNKEIADRLSVTLGTVKIRLHRARTQLHDELRRRCRCYRNERGELMGEPAGTLPAAGGKPPDRSQRQRKLASSSMLPFPR